MEIQTDTSLMLQSLTIDDDFLHVEKYAGYLRNVIENDDWDVDEVSIKLPGSKNEISRVVEVVSQMVSEKLEYVFLVGIGGSNLGTVAIHSALSHKYFSRNTPELINLDTIDASFIAKLKSRFDHGIDPESYLIFVISKSGGTTETIANAELLYTEILTAPEARTKRTVIITDAGSNLMKYADTHEISTLSIQSKVGGRFSVFSAVGMAPLYALGYDVASIQRGANDIIPYCTQADVRNNLAGLSAVYAHNCYGKGCIVYDMFCFDPSLEYIGKWQRQLLGESLGKEENKDGDIVETGMIPTTSIGSTDLHSVGQLYLGGIRAVFTMFLSVKNREIFSIQQEKNRYLPDLIPMISGKTTNDISSAIEQGTIDAYNEAGRPFLHAVLEDISEYELGAFMQTKMFETIYLGCLFNVNTFNQPNVEMYKKFTKEYLSAE